MLNELHLGERGNVKEEWSKMTGLLGFSGEVSVFRPEGDPGAGDSVSRRVLLHDLLDAKLFRGLQYDTSKLLNSA